MVIVGADLGVYWRKLNHYHFHPLPLGLVASVLSVLHIPGLYKVGQSNVLHHPHHHHCQLYLHQCNE